MGITEQPTRRFKDKLRNELDRQNVGVRTLARRLAKSDDLQQIETIRRRLNKYLAGDVSPTAPTRHEIEDALEMSRDALEADEDEESEPLHADLLAALAPLAALLRAAELRHLTSVPA